jgi:hypothetical protein
MIDPDDDQLGDVLSTDHKPTIAEVVDRASALMAELERMRAEYEAMTPEQRASLPEGTRRFFEGEVGAGRSADHDVDV